MADILDQIDDTLSAVTESMERNRQRFDPFGPPPLRRFKGGIEEEAVEPGAVVEETGLPPGVMTEAQFERYLRDGWRIPLDELVEPDPDVTVMPACQFDELMAALDEPDDVPVLRRAAERRFRRVPDGDAQQPGAEAGLEAGGSGRHLSAVPVAASDATPAARPWWRPRWWR